MIAALTMVMNIMLTPVLLPNQPWGQAVPVECAFHDHAFKEA